MAIPSFKFIEPYARQSFRGHDAKPVHVRCTGDSCGICLEINVSRNMETIANLVKGLLKP